MKKIAFFLIISMFLVVIGLNAFERSVDGLITSRDGTAEEFIGNGSDSLYTINIDTANLNSFWLYGIFAGDSTLTVDLVHYWPNVDTTSAISGGAAIISVNNGGLGAINVPDSILTAAPYMRVNIDPIGASTDTTTIVLYYSAKRSQ